MLRRLGLLLLSVVLGCEQTPCDGWQYNNPQVTIGEAKKYCRNRGRELAVEGGELICRCKSDAPTTQNPAETP